MQRGGPRVQGHAGVTGGPFAAASNLARPPTNLHRHASQHSIGSLAELQPTNSGDTRKSVGHSTLGFRVPLVTFRAEYDVKPLHMQCQHLCRLMTLQSWLNFPLRFVSAALVG